jgi:hypothetical protein
MAEGTARAYERVLGGHDDNTGARQQLRLGRFVSEKEL